MDKVLNTSEIIERFGKAVLETVEERDENTGYLRGHMKSGRLTAIRVWEDKDGLLHVSVIVPGGGGLGLRMQFWADEATEQGVDRFVQYYVKHRARTLERTLVYKEK